METCCRCGIEPAVVGSSEFGVCRTCVDAAMGKPASLTLTESEFERALRDAVSRGRNYGFNELDWWIKTAIARCRERGGS